MILSVGPAAAQHLGRSEDGNESPNQAISYLGPWAPPRMRGNWSGSDVVFHRASISEQAYMECFFRG